MSVVGDAISGVVFMAIYGLVITPLAIWKIVDIILWLFNNVSVTIGG